MGLKDDLNKTPNGPSPCTVRTILESIEDAEDRQALIEAIEKVRTEERPSRARIYSYQWLADVLSNNGYQISRSTVSRHITGGCSCGDIV